MKKAFVPKLAFEGIRKNRRMYLPYLLTWILMAAMFYIICYLAQPSVLEAIGRGGSTQVLLQFGTYVVALFAVIFLFYTNSFLLRRRKKEFGLYNILGMDKRGISRVYLWETQLIAVVSLILGLLAGIALSKLAELALSKLISGIATFTFTISWRAVLYTAVLFAGIFVLISASGLVQVRRLSPMQLLRSESYGEKAPKANWVLGLLGVAVLVLAYYFSVTIKNPVSALALFFVAVLLVIAATYLIFIAGSVLLCKILQKRKRYYYKKEHFVSVSSMAYRMKRNGAGLASICILLTMVLVMIASTTCLYFGAEDSLRTQYPNDFIVEAIDNDTGVTVLPENVEVYRAALTKLLTDEGVEAKNNSDYYYFGVAGLLHGTTLQAETSFVDTDTYDALTNVYILPVQDYERMSNKQVTVAPGQALVWGKQTQKLPKELTIGPVHFDLIPTEEAAIISSGSMIQGFANLYLVVDDYDTVTQTIQAYYMEKTGEILEQKWRFAFDTDLSSEEQLALYDKLSQTFIDALAQQNADGFGYRCEALEAQREDFYGTYGGFFFLGILLSMVFLIAAVLIIYYKQISEGYEDQSRFDIMQRVGMTKKDIRKSINSQMLTVFFLPIGMAVLHLVFAFPMLRKLLLLFGLLNTKLLILTTGVSVLICAVFYAIVYRITSNAYYSIVSGAKE
ncbi:MAG: ABC transporter permease [Clostridia bacterium]|nr:ABC transporter permease [Clostridia bacterium]